MERNDAGGFSGGANGRAFSRKISSKKSQSFYFSPPLIIFPLLCVIPILLPFSLNSLVFFLYLSLSYLLSVYISIWLCSQKKIWVEEDASSPFFFVIPIMCAYIPLPSLFCLSDCGCVSVYGSLIFSPYSFMLLWCM